MASQRYFFSPYPTPETFNNYIKSFYETLAKNVHVTNYNRKPVSRSFDFFKYAFRTDVMVLNWPEDVIHLRFGVLQFFISVASISMFKIKGGIVIWICHNKESHKKHHPFLRKISRFFFTQIANFIIVHSSDAIKFFPKQKDKLHYLPHPIYQKQQHKQNIDSSTPIDVLIWGNITPYKGLNSFINNYKDHNANFRVMIVGKADKTYFEELNEASKGLNIIIKDQFLDDEELDTYFHNSKIILLPYLDSDTFSSGALIHSLNSSKMVIGPNLGNFIDVNNYGACLVYKDYRDLFDLLNQFLSNPKKYNDELSILVGGINNYYKENSWDSFVKKLLSIQHKKFEHTFIN